jgi:hypothetical protein
MTYDDRQEEEGKRTSMLPSKATKDIDTTGLANYCSLPTCHAAANINDGIKWWCSEHAPGDTAQRPYSTLAEQDQPRTQRPYTPGQSGAFKSDSELLGLDIRPKRKGDI